MGIRWVRWLSTFRGLLGLWCLVGLIGPVWSAAQPPAPVVVDGGRWLPPLTASLPTAGFAEADDAADAAATDAAIGDDPIGEDAPTPGPGEAQCDPSGPLRADPAVLDPVLRMARPPVHAGSWWASVHPDGLQRPPSGPHAVH